jgi:hypothetical protein
MSDQRVDLDRLETLAKDASHGARWTAAFGVVRCNDAVFDEVCTAVRDDDAEWIAAADPATVLALVAELRVARLVVEAAQKANNAIDLIGTTEYSARCLFNLGQAVRTYDQHTTQDPGP